VVFGPFGKKMRKAMIGMNHFNTKRHSQCINIVILNFPMPFRHTETLVRQAQLKALIQAIIAFRQYGDESALELFLNSVETVIGEFGELNFNDLSQALEMED
jgi:hypothetical protein